MRKLEVTDMHRLTAEEFRQSEKMPLTVVLDNVRSMHNVGSVLRTADAFRVERVFMCGITSTPPHPELHKTALGAEDSVAWEYSRLTTDVISRLHAEGYTVYAVEQCEGSVMIDKLQIEVSKPRSLEIPKPRSSNNKPSIAIVLGNEVHGVQQEVVDMCDGCIEIPQFGTKHSLNVSVAAGIAIWEMARRLMLSIILLITCVSVTAQHDGALAEKTSLPVHWQSHWQMMDEPYYFEGEWIPNIMMPEIHLQAPMLFKNAAARKKYDRLVYNVKRVLPLAKQANALIRETYEVLQMLPNDDARDAHIRKVEKEVKRVYTPQLKRLSYSQGKLLIKLIDRECNQSSYQVVRAFLGQARATFYQVFAWTFRASLKKRYDRYGNDAMVEAIIEKIEKGEL